MRQCLTSPGDGYYNRKNDERTDPFGVSGDFVTAPEISQVFGELVGLWILTEWLAQGQRRNGVHLVELGPGRGTLMADLLRVREDIYVWSLQPS
jgi:SAM-dependent MidA family methyltransferase